VVLTDKRVSTYTSGFLTSVSTDISSWSDYFSGGWTVPGRQFNASDYRYAGFGQEQDNEIKGITGSSLDFGDRWLDTRRMGWGRPDRLTHKYPGWSSYIYTLGNPIFFYDPDGQKVIGFNNLRFNNTISSIGLMNGPVIRFITKQPYYYMNASPVFSNFLSKFDDDNGTYNENSNIKTNLVFTNNDDGANETSVEVVTSDGTYDLYNYNGQPEDIIAFNIKITLDKNAETDAALDIISHEAGIHAAENAEAIRAFTKSPTLENLNNLVAKYKGLIDDQETNGTSSSAHRDVFSKSSIYFKINESVLNTIKNNGWDIIPRDGEGNAHLLGNSLPRGGDWTSYQYFTFSNKLVLRYNAQAKLYSGNERLSLHEYRSERTSIKPIKK